MKRPLPVGVENFSDMVRNQYYYIDKTLLIKELLDLKGQVNLFTRPRRFGKTLNLSMLRYFFENTGNPQKNRENAGLFKDMKIMRAGAVYTDKMGAFPVINLTLKSAKQSSFELSYYQIKEAIREEFKRHSWILDGAFLDEDEKETYRKLSSGTAEEISWHTALKFLSTCLFKATGQKTVLLIDEYDVPLENAYFRGFYSKMAELVRSLFESVLKTNEYLEFAVITGCLRISRESIFTGLNHLNIISVLDKQYSEHFGFTSQEVKEMMTFYNRRARYDTMRKWYDGYLFGDIEVYNPWSVIKFMYDLEADENAFPRPYWANTSSNDIVKKLIKNAGQETRLRIEQLMAGESLDICIHEEITYEDIEESTENLWNFLYFTGYLTKKRERFEGRNIILEAVIPNEELKSVYENIIIKWFRETIEKQDFHDLYDAMEIGDTEHMSRILNSQLVNTISFYDSAESFYHGFLTGVLSQSSKYIVKSNRESGLGRTDLLIYSPDIGSRAFVLELKAAASYGQLSKACDAALRQIEEKHYTEYLKDIGYEDIVCYGIAFFRKNCKVKKS